MMVSSRWKKQVFQVIPRIEVSIRRWKDQTKKPSSHIPPRPLQLDNTWALGQVC
ncbi:hypothetical protein T12_15526 [Trichinella patagoniensis]|uniref:Uncharacterized protein n=1 Tax=Trichinella patagoniensis TaxID=990121 RepID=A0A0V0WT93_9BILA|nr:hypothetical protein T12_15526 [Trichinella patagoniensis]